jgi:hypothetical protein
MVLRLWAIVIQDLGVEDNDKYLGQQQLLYVWFSASTSHYTCMYSTSGTYSAWKTNFHFMRTSKSRTLESVDTGPYVLPREKIIIMKI